MVFNARYLVRGVEAGYTLLVVGLTAGSERFRRRMDMIRLTVPALECCRSWLFPDFHMKSLADGFECLSQLVSKVS